MVASPTVAFVACVSLLLGYLTCLQLHPVAQVNETVTEEDFEVESLEKVEVLTVERVLAKEQCPAEPEPEPALRVLAPPVEAVQGPSVRRRPHGRKVKRGRHRRVQIQL